MRRWSTPAWRKPGTTREPGGAAGTCSGMEHTHASDTPLRLARSADERVVVVYSPRGERIALSAAAAMLSARDLARAARLAARARVRAASVVRVRFDNLRHLPQRHWQALRGRLRHQELRRTVAGLLLPLGIGIAAALVLLSAIALLGAAAGLAAGLLLSPLIVALAVLLSWIAAPWFMNRDEHVWRPPAGTRPKLVTSDGDAGSSS